MGEKLIDCATALYHIAPNVLNELGLRLSLLVGEPYDEHQRKCCNRMSVMLQKRVLAEEGADVGFGN